MSKTIANLNYISLGAGFIIGLQISHPLMDKVSPHNVLTPLGRITNKLTTALRLLPTHHPSGRWRRRMVRTLPFPLPHSPTNHFSGASHLC